MRPRFLPVLLILTLSASGCSTDTASELRSFLVAYCGSHPAAELQDIYKLLYQAEFGPGHAISSASAARAYLREEIAAMNGGPETRMVESCDPGGTVVRVHLRPYVRGGYSADSLAAAMVRSAARMNPDTAAFARRWAEVLAMCRDGTLPFDADSAAAFSRRVSDAGYPPVHHSAAFRHAYAPAYRVVLRDELSPGVK
jgi:hypothetical protein